MVAGYPFELLRALRNVAGGKVTSWTNRSAPRVLDQIFIERRVAGQNGRAGPIIDAIAEGRQFLAAVVDFERADLGSHPAPEFNAFS